MSKLQNVTLGNRVMAYVIGQTEVRSYWRKVGPYPGMTDVLVRRENLDTDVHAGRAHVKTEAEDGVIRLQAKAHDFQ